MQDVGNVNPELLKPRVLRTTRRALGKDQSIVLIHRQQTFAAAGRAKNGHRIGAAWLAMARFTHALFSDYRGLSRERAEFARNDGSDFARAYAFRQ